MSSSSRSDNHSGGDKKRNRRFLDNLQNSMGTGTGIRRNKPKQQINNEGFPKDYNELIEMLNSEKRNLSLSDLGLNFLKMPFIWFNYFFQGCITDITILH